MTQTPHASYNYSHVTWRSLDHEKRAEN